MSIYIAASPGTPSSEKSKAEQMASLQGFNQFMLLGWRVVHEAGLGLIPLLFITISIRTARIPPILVTVYTMVLYFIRLLVVLLLTLTSFTIPSCSSAVRREISFARAIAEFRYSLVKSRAFLNAVAPSMKARRLVMA
jgi:hypothetical protein